MKKLLIFLIGILIYAVYTNTDILILTRGEKKKFFTRNKRCNADAFLFIFSHLNTVLLPLFSLLSKRYATLQLS